MSIRRIAVNTGGGDAPGLNAVIRAVVLSALRRGWEVVGIRQGYNGLLDGSEDGLMPLDAKAVRGITHLGGTILGTTNRGNPFAWAGPDPSAGTQPEDRSAHVIEAFERQEIDALVAIGGDGSLRIAERLYRQGLPVVGVPKTIDNDLAATAVTFGFQTAVETATDALDRLHSTAEAHERVMVVEVMGRHTGWIALFAGMSATADVILVPEIPYSIDAVCEKIRRRYARGRRFAIVVVAEGAAGRDESPSYAQAGRYGGICVRLADQISERTGIETRTLVLGHLQRGGRPNAYDRLLALRFGAAAVQLLADGCVGCMVALHPPEVEAVPLSEAVAQRKQVPVDGDVVQTARALGISLGD